MSDAATIEAPVSKYDEVQLQEIARLFRTSYQKDPTDAGRYNICPFDLYAPHHADSDGKSWSLWGSTVIRGRAPSLRDPGSPDEEDPFEIGTYPTFDEACKALGVKLGEIFIESAEDFARASQEADRCADEERMLKEKGHGPWH